MKARNAASRRREPRSTRDLILDVAEARFAERGFAGVSVREIAADVGLKNQASLYHHFKNKRALYEAVLARGVEAIVAMVASSAPQESEAAAPPGELLDATLGRVVDYLVEHPHLPRLIQRAGLDDIKYMRSAVTQVLRPLYQQGIAIMSTADTAFSPAEMPQLGAGLYHLIFGYFANAKLIEAVTQQNPLSTTALTQQRTFIRTAVGMLLGAHSGAAPSDPTATSGPKPRKTPR